MFLSQFSKGELQAKESLDTNTVLCFKRFLESWIEGFCSNSATPRRHRILRGLVMAFALSTRPPGARLDPRSPARLGYHLQVADPHS